LTEPFLATYDLMLARWPVPVERIEVPSRFGTTRVNACGPVDGPPVVLLPGGGATSTIWYANVAALSRTHRVFAVDLIGDRGLTAYDGEPVTNRDDLMEWLGSCLSGLGVARTHLVGHSYGAWIALRYALHAPDRIAGLALLDPSQCFGGQRFGYLLHAVPLFVRPGQESRRRFFAWETSGAIDPTVLDVMCLPSGGGKAGPPKEPAGAKFVWPKRPTDDELRTLAVPTLVLLAGDSRQNNVRDLERTARRLVRDVTVHVVAGATHHTMPDLCAGEVNRELVVFLGR
jgi:pimeloyl-ACP methyl ester carboxylesterase